MLLIILNKLGDVVNQLILTELRLLLLRGNLLIVDLLLRSSGSQSIVLLSNFTQVRWGSLTHTWDRLLVQRIDALCQATYCAFINTACFGSCVTSIWGVRTSPLVSTRIWISTHWSREEVLLLDLVMMMVHHTWSTSTTGLAVPSLVDSRGFVWRSPLNAAWLWLGDRGWAACSIIHWWLDLAHTASTWCTNALRAIACSLIIISPRSTPLGVMWLHLQALYKLLIVGACSTLSIPYTFYGMSHFQ